jgi:Icc-related predicted phosphoesterase
VKILALSDEVVDFIYSPTVRDRFGDVDLIAGCGDLPAKYLEYVVTELNVPLVFVPGNHDDDNQAVPGGRSVDGTVLNVKGLSIAGLGGSRRYKRDGRHQYTEAEMQWRVVRLATRLSMARLRRGRGLDLWITHAPPLGIHDATDLPHIGFASYRGFLQAFRPLLMLHGHSHSNRNLVETDTRFLGTRIVNVYPYRVVEFPEAR